MYVKQQGGKKNVLEFFFNILYSARVLLNTERTKQFYLQTLNLKMYLKLFSLCWIKRN